MREKLYKDKNDQVKERKASTFGKFGKACAASVGLGLVGECVSVGLGVTAAAVLLPASLLVGAAILVAGLKYTYYKQSAFDKEATIQCEQQDPETFKALQEAEQELAKLKAEK